MDVDRLLKLRLNEKERESDSWQNAYEDFNLSEVSIAYDLGRYFRDYPLSSGGVLTCQESIILNFQSCFSPALQQEL